MKFSCLKFQKLVPARGGAGVGGAILRGYFITRAGSETKRPLLESIHTRMFYPRAHTSSATTFSLSKGRGGGGGWKCCLQKLNFDSNFVSIPTFNRSDRGIEKEKNFLKNSISMRDIPRSQEMLVL
jgi:hypothetical protein